MEDVGKTAYEIYRDHLLNTYACLHDDWSDLPAFEQETWRTMAEQMLEKGKQSR